MNIVEILKDCKLTHKQQVFAGYIKEKVDSYICLKPITNRSMLRMYLAPDNEFIMYSTAAAGPPQLLLRNYKQVS